MQINWAPEHADALREYHARGMSFSEIADAINARFKTSYSRNATIGRARRMGLASPKRPVDRPRPPPKAAATRLRKSRERHAPELPRQVSVSERAEPAKLRCVEIAPRHLSLVDLEPGDCRYPYGGDADGELITFCGHPRRTGSSYCTPHFHLTRGPGTASERAAGIVLLRACGGCVKRGSIVALARIAARMQPLPRRHRIAHLRALIRRAPVHSIRGEQLTELLLDEMTTQPARKAAP